MNNSIAFDGDTKYLRVTKAKARKAFDACEVVILCPVKLYPFGGFRPSCMFQNTQSDLTFDDVVTQFVYYNCQLNETGYYPSYWVQQ